MNILQRFFNLAHNQTTLSREILAGVTTFLTMSYIIFVNPAVLHDAGMDLGAVYVATCLVTMLSCFLVCVLANYPVVVAPAMGLNIFFTYSVVLGLGYSWQNALGIVFISGVIFFILAVTKIRIWIIESIPESINLAIAVGLGMFIAMIGLENGGIIVKSTGKSLLNLGHITSLPCLLFFLGFAIIAVLDHLRVHGAIIISIIIITLFSLVLRLSHFYGIFALPPTIAPTFLAANIKGVLHYEYVPIIFSFLLLAFFDATGTMIGLLQNPFFKNDLKFTQRISRTLVSDSLGTIGGSLLGTSSTSPYLESAAGIEAGGKTGLTALTVSILFLLVLFLSPLVKAVPSFAVAPALFYVGLLMMKNVVLFDTKDATEFVPCIMTALMIPFTFSIADGIGIGAISYVVLKLATGKYKSLNAVLYLLAVIFIIYFAFKV